MMLGCVFLFAGHPGYIGRGVSALFGGLSKLYIKDTEGKQ